MGEPIQLLLADVGFAPAKLFSVPGTVNAVTSLVGEILITAQENLDKGELKAVYIFHNQPKPVTGHLPVMQRLLPLDEKWRSTITEKKGPIIKYRRWQVVCSPLYQPSCGNIFLCRCLKHVPNLWRVKMQAA